MDEGLKELFIELYWLKKDPEWTIERQIALDEKITKKINEIKI